MDRDRDKYSLINFEETELCLGLPGSGNKGRVINNYNDEEANEIPLKSTTNCFINGKRGRFSETHVDLKLNLSSNNDKELGLNNNNNNNINEVDDDKAKNIDSVKPPAYKAQVVGWPPVRSFRKNIVAVQKHNKDHEQVDPKAISTSTPALVKVSMDGAPYLRKVDLKLYKSYQELSDALGKLFSSFTSGKDSKLKDILNGSEYVATFEDKDGDWMLVGDVPWEMFVESCKRLQIMKGSEAIGLAPRAMEKLMKNRI